MKQKKMICALACALCLLGGGASLAAAPAPASTAPAAGTAAPLVSSVTSIARCTGQRILDTKSQKLDVKKINK